ncbi:hypothetical protein [Solicola gregarius]|uniref:Uncharacterized protein n=1 Tax=Solicola gregarius TaxID=2908642 RepID=A0AA46TIQ6_9ACTN|nr:hypothetical protein [Solicola gregarius]UYM06082.1 hypothetical protein L0C25_03135 [Solicola gregarius]
MEGLQFVLESDQTLTKSLTVCEELGYLGSDPRSVCGVPVVTPEPDDEDDSVELTPEQRERLRRAFDNLHGAMLPKFDFNLPDLAGLTRAQASIAKAVAIPDSVTKNLSAFTGISTAAAEALKPFRAAQAQWAKQMSVINSDALKSLSAMPQMDSIFAEIARNAEFADSVSRLADQIAKHHEATFRSLAESARKLSTAFYPANLRGIDDLEFSAVEEVVLEDGIALYVVPRTVIAEALVHAEGTDVRLAIIEHEWKAIAEDCRVALDACTTEYVAEWVATGLAALDALDGGHHSAAQALVGSLTDTVVTSYMGDRDTKRKFTPDRSGSRTNDEYRKLGVRSLIALGPIWQAHRQFHAEDGDAIPTTFNRHATAHTVSAEQYTRRNLVQGLMLVCSLISFVNERAVSEEAA